MTTPRGLSSFPGATPSKYVADRLIARGLIYLISASRARDKSRIERRPIYCLASLVARRLGASPNNNNASRVRRETTTLPLPPIIMVITSNFFVVSRIRPSAARARSINFRIARRSEINTQSRESRGRMKRGRERVQRSERVAPRGEN